MNFERIVVRGWHAMDVVDLDLSGRTTILTGANGSGKTSILRILAMHAQWAAVDFKTPDDSSIQAPTSSIDYEAIGTVHYSNQLQSVVMAGRSNAVRGHLAMPLSQKVPSIFIPSVRASALYESVTAIGFTHIDGFSAQEVLESSIRAQRGSIDVRTMTQSIAVEHFVPTGFKEITHSPASVLGVIKQAIFAWTVGAYGIRAGSRFIIEPILEYKDYFEKFEITLKSALPDQFKFENIEISRMGELVLSCRDGRERFIIEGASGGMTSMIEMIWMIFLTDLNTPPDSSYTVLIDEVENHLHPSIQRTVLPNLERAFPRARFIVSTHSPFVVSSVKDATIYALHYNDENLISATQLDFVNQAKTAAQILDEVLGVSVTLPVWAEENLQRLIDEYARRPVTPEIFDNLKNDLRTQGLESFTPEAIEGVVKKK
ncbi:AAA family ATPase [Burkholderia cepacia]|uniref:AAA family ATPase n=1 Tax=Burkholderia cepacia TaxID=292 RepID=UPI0009C19803|nr:AAA family ATPase [Burkholderia cepacia]